MWVLFQRNYLEIHFTGSVHRLHYHGDAVSLDLCPEVPLPLLTTANVRIFI